MSRQIDNMTDKELDTLALKGPRGSGILGEPPGAYGYAGPMTAPPRRLNKAQHSPLPWHIGMKPGPIIYGPQGEQIANMHVAMLDQDEHRANAKLIVASVNHADKLAEALREIVEHPYWKGISIKATQALKAYEAAQ